MAPETAFCFPWRLPRMLAGLTERPSRRPSVTLYVALPSTQRGGAQDTARSELSPFLDDLHFKLVSRPRSSPPLGLRVAMCLSWA